LTLRRLGRAGRTTAQFNADCAGPLTGGPRRESVARKFPGHSHPTHPKGTVMRLRWRRHLTGIVAGTIVALAAGPLAGAGAGVAMAGPICPNGTHWDNITFTCH